MQKAYYIVTEDLMISLLVGKLVRFLCAENGIKLARFVAIIDGKNHVYQFRDSDNITTDSYISKATILYMDYDWGSNEFNDDINKSKNLTVKNYLKPLYNKFN